MPSRIEGSVAQVLNAREVVINRGQTHGVESGMRFAILNRHGAGITDPDTGEPLDSVEVEKTVVKIVRVYERSAVGRTFRTVTSGSFGAASALQEMFAPARREYETLKTDEKMYVEELDEAESYVKRGDPVVQVTGEEFSRE